MDVTAPQDALGINEILRSIYGFVLGTNLDRITENMQMQMRLVSQQFNECVIAYLKSAHLKLQYGSNGSYIVKWMKGHDIIRLYELRIKVFDYLQRVTADFTGLDFSNLSVLHLLIRPYSIYPAEEVQNFLSLFSGSSSVMALTVSDFHNSTSSVVMYNTFLSHLPILKSLDMDFGYTNADTDRVTRSIKNCPQLERLVHHSLSGNYTLRSHSLKFLNLSPCVLDSICLDCPSLEKLVCCNPVLIGTTSGSVLAEEFGNDEVGFIKEHLELCEMRPSDSNILASVSIIPSDSLESTANDFFRVGTDCRVILFTSK